MREREREMKERTRVRERERETRDWHAGRAVCCPRSRVISPLFRSLSYSLSSSTSHPLSPSRSPPSVILFPSSFVSVPPRCGYFCAARRRLCTSSLSWRLLFAYYSGNKIVPARRTLRRRINGSGSKLQPATDASGASRIE